MALSRVVRSLAVVAALVGGAGAGFAQDAGGTETKSPPLTVPPAGGETGDGPAGPAALERWRVDRRFIVTGRRGKTVRYAGRSFVALETWLGAVRVPVEYVEDLGPAPKGEGEGEAAMFERIQTPYLKGSVSRSRLDSERAVPVRFFDDTARRECVVNLPGAILAPGDRVTTGRDGAAILQLPGAGIVRLDENAEFLTYPLSAARRGVSAELQGGRCYVRIDRAPPGRLFRIAAGAWLLSFREAAFFADRHPDGSLGLRVSAGAVLVTKPGDKTFAAGNVIARQACTFPPGGEPARPLRPAEVEWMSAFERFYRRHYSLPAGDFCYVPAGPFVRGDLTPGENGPAHEAWLDAYLVDTFETSRGDFQNFLDATGYRLVQAVGWRDLRPTVPGGEEPAEAVHPVDGLSWYDAEAYAAWAGRRLPTEAQWEKAAKGVRNQRYPWGDEEPTRDHGRFTLESLWTGPAPVDAFEKGASPFGVFNMAGNVAEWVRDFWDRDFYRAGWSQVSQARQFRHHTAPAGPVPGPTGAEEWAVQNPFRDTPPDGAGASAGERVYRGGRYDTRVGDPDERRNLFTTTRRHAPAEFGIRGVGFRTAIPAAQVFPTE
ncbi:MAG: SUMF1/EgtB/PvdO family nonheme iron enzyme [Planctomycetes bacterium]|nr:SUMF1/EgtB/PvdO family nonheme iron enzyme [Planctomycetota bacterium]